MKEKLRKFGLISMIALLYLSNTGLLYSVHTCLHTGASVIEFSYMVSKDDHCPPNDNELQCNDVKDDCCAPKADEKSDCHTHTTEYKKADIVSVKPEIKVSSILDYSVLSTLISFTPFITPTQSVDQNPFWDFLKRTKTSLARTGLQQRIDLNSFIC